MVFKINSALDAIAAKVYNRVVWVSARLLHEGTGGFTRALSDDLQMLMG